MFLRSSLVAFICSETKVNTDLDQYSFSATVNYGETTVWINVFIKRPMFTAEELPKKGDLVYIEGALNLSKKNSEFKSYILNASFLRYIRKSRTAAATLSKEASPTITEELLNKEIEKITAEETTRKRKQK